MTDTDSAPRGKRLVQCPGCWATGVLPSDVQHECDHCGEAMTVVDLREARATRSPDAPGGPLFMSQPETDEQVFGAASPSVTLPSADDLGWVLYEMGVDDLDLDDARKLAAHIITRLAERGRE